MAAAGVAAMLLVSACRHDLPVAGATPSQDASPGTDIVAGERGFSACGARFHIPDAWAPVALDGDRWELTGPRTSADGFRVSVQCLQDIVVSPGMLYTDIDTVQDELGRGPEADRAFRMYVAWLMPGLQRPEVVALRQEQRDGPARVEVGVWADPDKRMSFDPPSPRQGLVAIHWLADDPGQVKQYEAFRARFDSSFSVTMPDTAHDRTRTP